MLEDMTIIPLLAFQGYPPALRVHFIDKGNGFPLLGPRQDFQQAVAIEVGDGKLL